MSSVRCEGFDGRAPVSVSGFLPPPSSSSGTITTKGDVGWQQASPHHQHQHRHGRQLQQQQQCPVETVSLVDSRQGGYAGFPAQSSGEIERSLTPSTTTTTTTTGVSKPPRTTRGGAEGREALRQIHAQSSAETSGVGSDILQRIHALSSTETSGYGGDANLQSPIDLASPASPDSHVQHHHHHHHHIHQQEHRNQQPVGKINEKQHHQHPNPSYDGSGRTLRSKAADGNGIAMSTAEAVGGGGHERRGVGRATDEQRQYGRIGNAAASNGRHHRSDEYRHDDGYYCGEEDDLSDVSTSSRHRQRNSSTAPAQHHRTDGKNGSSRVGGGCVASASTVIIGSAGGAMPAEDGADGQFLGRGTQSAWLRWSHERRASFRRRVEIAEQRQSELERYRVPSPVRKARQESARFVSAALEVHHQLLVADGTAIAVGAGSTDRHHPSRRRDVDADGGPLEIGLGNVACGHPAFPFDIPPPAAVGGVIARKPGRKNGATGGSDTEKLTLAQWNALVAFWEHPVFARARFIGLLFGFAALVVGITGVVDNHWTNYNNHSSYGVAHSGLWHICSVSSVGNCTEVDYTKFHIAVIGQVMFTLTFGLVACVLSVGGLCTSSLPKKVYYYHSAGEIHVICAVSDILVLVLYLMSADLPRQLTTDEALLYDGATIGRGFFLVAGAAIFFAAGAISMCLDDLVRTMTKGVCGRRAVAADGRGRRPTVRR